MPWVWIIHANRSVAEVLTTDNPLRTDECRLIGAGGAEQAASLLQLPSAFLRLQKLRDWKCMASRRLGRVLCHCFLLRVEVPNFFRSHSTILN